MRKSLKTSERVLMHRCMKRMQRYKSITALRITGLQTYCSVIRILNIKLMNDETIALLKVDKIDDACGTKCTLESHSTLVKTVMLEQYFYQNKMLQEQ